MDYRSDPLWQRILDFSFDDDKNAVVTFSQKLAFNQVWSQEFTEKAIYEYRKFIYLCCVSPSGASPSPIVDEVWHLHLTYTVNYWKKFCEQTIDKEIHHHPSSGGRWQKQKHDAWYRDTLQLYKHIYQEDPPKDIWPGAANALELLDEFHDLKVRFFEPGNRARYLLLLLPFATISALYHNLNPYTLTGRHFLVFYAVLGTVVAVAMVHLMNARRRLLTPELENLDRSISNAALLMNNRESYCRSLLNEALEDRVLNQVDDASGEVYFDVDRSLLENYSHPIAPYLHQFSGWQMSSYDFENYVYRYIETIEQPVKELRQAYERWVNYMTTPLLFIVIGVARCAQGIDNEKPVTFLVLLMLFFSAIFFMLVMANDFDNLTFFYFEKNRKDAKGEEGSLRKAFLSAGALGIVAVWAFYGAKAKPNGKRFGGDGTGSGCTGGGCSGGGCSGGGCGGCGGCGGGGD